MEVMQEVDRGVAMFYVSSDVSSPASVVKIVGTLSACFRVKAYKLYKLYKLQTL